MIPHLEPIKSPCFPLGDWLLWPPSLEPENLPWSCSAPDILVVILFQFCLIWLPAWVKKLVTLLSRGGKRHRKPIRIIFSTLTEVNPHNLVWMASLKKKLVHKQQKQTNWGQCSKEKRKKRSYSSPSNFWDAAACLFINKGLARWVIKHLWKSLKGLSITM